MTQVNAPDGKTGASSPAKIVIISSVMFVFISYWRVAAIVLCDLASTAYYIGGIVEHSIGPAAPWFIIGVMIFSYAVRSVYIESCSMFVRGGVYRIVKESLGRGVAKLAVSALLFDYVLTGPISGVSAGQYLISLLLELWTHTSGVSIAPETRDWWKATGSVVIALAITAYFFRLNVVGIHESSDKALKIMIATTIMGVLVLGWSLVTLAIQGPQNPITFQPTFTSKPNPSNGQMESPLGFLEGTGLGDRLVAMNGSDWLGLIGVVGFFLAFGHSVLAMSGEETLAQIYREIESPKLKNFQRAALIVFIFSLVLTGGISLLAVLLIPNEVRMSQYSDNLIGGLAMHVIGPPAVRLALNVFVVVIGSLILAGAVNTALIGSNGVLNRVAEDGVIPDWFLKPHPVYGTTHRVLFLIFGLQVITILVSRGDVLLLGEAYAFGVVWSFVFNCLAMLVLRFKDPDRPRGFKVPGNFRIRGVEIPVGLGLIFLVLLLSAIMNVMTKELATEAGLSFTIILYLLFLVAEYQRPTPANTSAEEHLDQFNEISTDTVTSEQLGLKHQYRKLVAIRAPQAMDALNKVLQETNPSTTDVVVMKAQVRPPGGIHSESVFVDRYEQEVLNAVEKRAEVAGKTVVPLIVSTNDALHAVLQTAMAIGAQEVVAGTSEKYTPGQQFARVTSYWAELHNHQPAPLTVRIVGGNRDLFLDIDGGNRIPNGQAILPRSVNELRQHEIGADRLLLLHDGTERSSELLHSLVAILDSQIPIDVIQVTGASDEKFNNDIKFVKTLRREIAVPKLPEASPFEDSLVKVIRDSGADVIVARQSLATFNDRNGATVSDWAERVVRSTRCQVLLAVELAEGEAPANKSDPDSTPDL